jgi:deoxycytidine triphosphate deaminase
MSIQERREKFVKMRQRYKSQNGAHQKANIRNSQMKTNGGISNSVDGITHSNIKNGSGSKEGIISKKISEVQGTKRIRNVSAILSDQDIWHEHKNGNVVIYPFSLNLLEPNKYPVTVGEWYYILHDETKYINPWNKTHLRAQWEGPLHAKPVDEEMEQEAGISKGKECIIIPPGKTILTHTQEFIGGLNYVTYRFETREMLYYSGISCLNDKCYGEMGTYDKRPLFIKNHTEAPIVMPVGAKIGHILFYYVGATKKYLKGKIHTCQYLDEVVENWHPSKLFASVNTTRKSSMTNINSAEIAKIYQNGENVIQGLRFNPSSGATVSGATVSGATVSGTTVSGATVSGTTVSGTTVSGATRSPHLTPNEKSSEKFLSLSSPTAGKKNTIVNISKLPLSNNTGLTQKLSAPVYSPRNQDKQGSSPRSPTPPGILKSAKEESPKDKTSKKKKDKKDKKKKKDKNS